MEPGIIPFDPNRRQKNEQPESEVPQDNRNSEADFLLDIFLPPVGSREDSATNSLGDEVQGPPNPSEP